MRKKWLFGILAVCLACCALCTACADKPESTDYGALTVADITVTVNETADIQPVFSKEEGKGAITYAFDGNNISIADGKVTGLVEATETVVTAKTEHLETTFTVTVLAADRGTLTVADMELEADSAGETIQPQFSTEAGRSEVVYTFEGANIAIVDGVVKPLVPNTQTTVTATTPYHSVTFTVKVKAVDYGTLTITAPPVYTNYPGQLLNVVFSRPTYTEQITYTVESAYADKVTVTNGAVKAVGEFANPANVKVTATTEHHSTEFTVRVSRFDGATASGASLNLETEVTDRLAYWQRCGGDTGGVLFIGDSFFDHRYFWTNFYTTFARKNVFTMGISATTTTDWEMLVHRLVFPVEPSKVVIHCGTNNIFDDSENALTATANIKKLFEMIHDELPDCEIYYFGIEPRVGQNNAASESCNTRVQAYCELHDWIEYIDSPAFCYESDGTTLKQSFYKDKDTIHPALESYALYLDALDALGVTYAPSSAMQNTSIADITTTLSDKVSDGSPIVYRGMGLRKEYVLVGKIDITDSSKNAHIQFPFSGDSNRFLLWDSNSNGKFGLGWGCNGYTNETGYEKFERPEEGALTLVFKLIVTSKNAYMYLGADDASLLLEAVFVNVPVTQDIRISSEATAMRVYDMQAKTKVDDAAEYAALLAAANEIAAYESGAGSGGVMLSNTLPSIGDAAAVIRTSGQINPSNGFRLAGGALGGVRDWGVIADGKGRFTGDFALMLDVSLKSNAFEDITVADHTSINDKNWFQYIGVSKTTGPDDWEQYYLFYISRYAQSNGAADNASVGAYFGNATKINAESWNKFCNEFTAVNLRYVIVRQGDTVFLAMLPTDAQNNPTNSWVVSETAGFDGVALSVWIGAENVNSVVSNFFFSQDTAAITAALTEIGKNA